jgi:hypothetical protein
VAKGPKPRSALSAASTPVRGALIAFVATTSQAQAEATKAAQPSRCCSTESTSTVQLAYLCLIVLRIFSQKTPYAGINAEAASQGFSRKQINRTQIAGGTDVTSAPVGDEATAVCSLNKSVVKRVPDEIDSVGRLIAFLPSRLMSSLFDVRT